MVSYFNIFDICADSENVLTCFYITITFISVCTFCIIMSMILAFYGKHFKFVNNSIVKKFITLLASVMYIPCLLILFGIFNYDTAETGLNQLQIGAISLFFVICLIIIRVLYELFTADLAHANTKKNIRARTNSNLDLILILFNTILVFSSTFTKDNHFYLQEAILVFSVVIFKLFHMRLPYYNPIENVILCFKMLSIAITTAGFMIAYLIDSAHVVIIFYFVLQPVALILLIQNVKTRQMNLSQSVVTILSQDDFELKYRDSLCNKKLVDKERVLNAISTIYHDRNIAKNNLLLVWEFYFCYHVVKDESLARIKLSKLSNLRRSVEGYFQE